MFFAASFVSAAVMLLSTVHAIPKGAVNAVEARGAVTCPAGYYDTGNSTCAICPPGYTLRLAEGVRTTAKQCVTPDMPHPNNGTIGVCAACPAGTYQNQRGAASCISCPPGQYSLYPASSSCNLVSGGAFVSLPGQNLTCLTCCGYAAVGNGNTVATRCTGSKPFAYPGSGSGCISQNISSTCTPPPTCTQAANGTCRAYPFILPYAAILT
ncbi:hypothetical protein B0H11DRAFT_1900539 [Mycena galericulata]|nr:hypothetical protein B0H11DRAFT_1900539 [Mycena galericulata]